MLPAEIAVALQGLDLGAVESVERIKHGLTNESWLARTGDDAFVIRLSNTSEESLQINRASEARILEAAAQAGIGPDVIRCDPARHILVTRYAGATWSPADALNPENIERIAVLLRQLHQLSPLEDVQAVDLLAVIDGYLGTLDAHDVRCAAAEPALQQQAKQITATLHLDLTPCLCHNDVHALNIVDDGRLRLIDWEYAGVGDRYFDLASICVYHRYRKPQREQLLAAYAGEPRAGDWHRLELACWLFDYIRDLWTAVRGLEQD